MLRREFIGLIGTGALSFSRPGLAQTKTGLPLIGFLNPSPTEIGKVSVAALRSGLQAEGLIEGVNYSLATRFAGGDMDRLPGLASELAALKPRVIVAAANAAPVVRKLFPEIPMVFTAYAADPIAAGFAESYARPGGTATGKSPGRRRRGDTVRRRPCETNTATAAPPSARQSASMPRWARPAPPAARPRRRPAAAPRPVSTCRPIAALSRVEQSAGSEPC